MRLLILLLVIPSVYCLFPCLKYFVFGNIPYGKQILCETGYCVKYDLFVETVDQEQPIYVEWGGCDKGNFCFHSMVFNKSMDVQEYHAIYGGLIHPIFQRFEVFGRCCDSFDCNGDMDKLRLIPPSL